MVSIDLKDWILLVLSFGLGIFASIIAALILGPGLTIVSGFRATKFVVGLRQKFAKDTVFDRDWTQTWTVESSTTYPPMNTSPLRLYRFLHLVAGEADMVTKTGVPVSFRIVGVIDGNYLTGKWMDPTPGGYYGVFQLIKRPSNDLIDGSWAGFSKKGTVRSGVWKWQRV
jgi:hypothetical protein